MATAELLALIGMTENDVVRFRGASMEEDGSVRVETRLGGGNAECWCGPEHESFCYVPDIDALRARPNYVRDEDDWGDSTYRYFYFKPVVPAVPKEEVK